MIILIYAIRTITVKDGNSIIDEPVVLYRGDKEIELVFGVLQQSFKFGKSENLIKTSKASHGQLIIEKLDGSFIFSSISECENGKIKFVMTEFMIDELSEVGIYDIQIRLYDDTIHSRISIPPIKNAIEVREPLTVANPAVADQGIVDLSIIDKAGEEEEIFDEEGSYIKTEWSPGDTITSAKLNKIEFSLETINNNDIQKDIDTNAKLDEITERLDAGDVNIDLSAYAKTADIPTKTSELTNDSNFLTYIPSAYVTEYELNAKGYLTEHQDISNKADKSEIPTKTSQLTNDSNFLTSIPSEYITETELNTKGYLTEHQDISNKVDKVSGKGLSTNDYTTAEKNKLAGIESGANNVIVYTAKECTTFTSDSGTCTPLAVQKAVGLFPPKEHEHSQYLTEHQDISNKADKSEINKCSAYGTCDTEAATAEKVVVIDDPNWKLQIGNMITVGFSIANTASNVTLNANNTGAYGIKTSGESAYTGTSTTYCGNANRALTYVFDGSYWQWISSGAYPSSATNVSLGQGYATCSTAASTKAKTASLSSYTLSTGGIVAVKFTYDVPADATLNINSKGAKNIYHKGAAIEDGVIKAGDTATFMYSTRYHLISIDRDETFSGDYNDLTNAPTIPSKTSELTNDSDFVSTVDFSSNLTLGYNTDGKLYIFFNGVPIGTGVEIATISGDVTGVIDENNDIILTGDLADGSYRIMYQYEDGSFSAPITVTVGKLETYANILETAMEEGLTEVYNGIGYKANLRWSGSSSAFVSATKCVLTGLIPVGVNGDVFHVRGVDMVGYTDGRQSGWYHCYDSQGSRLQMAAGTISKATISNDENGDFTITMNHSNFKIPSGTAYIRFQFGEIIGDFIMSRNFLIP